MRNANLILAVVASLAVFAASGAKPDIDEGVKTMRANGSKTITGSDDSVGLWIMALGSRSLEGLSQKDADAMAEIDARKAIAGFLQSSISATAEMSVTESGAGSSESFKQWARTDINELLKGCRIERMFTSGDTAYAVALLTQKSIDASDLMKRAMAGERPGTVRATATGSSKEDAVQKACRSALEQFFGSSMVASDASFNDDVRRRAYADVQGSVSAYRVIVERPEGDRVYVEIVAEINKDELKESFGAEMKSVGDPVFLLDCQREDLKILIADWMTQHGIKVNEGTKGADYKIKVNPTFYQVTHPANGRKGVQLSLNLDCFDKAGNKFFSLKNDPRKAAAFISHQERQMQICVDKAMAQMEKPLHQHVQKAVSSMVNNGRQARLVFRNVTTKEQTGYLQQLVAVINDMGTAGSASYALREDVLVATVRFNLKGNLNDFIEDIKKLNIGIPPPLQVSTNKAVFEF